MSYVIPSFIVSCSRAYFEIRSTTKMCAVAGDSAQLFLSGYCCLALLLLLTVSRFHDDNIIIIFVTRSHAQPPSGIFFIFFSLSSLFTVEIFLRRAYTISYWYAAAAAVVDHLLRDCVFFYGFFRFFLFPRG